MAVKGIYGFRKNNSDKLSYNHFDSFPSGLGMEIISFIKSHSLEEMNKLYDELILLSEDKYFKELPLEQKNGIEELEEKYCESFEDKRVSYVLAIFEGNLEMYCDYPKIRFMRDNSEFIKDSLNCEWGYIINLDNNTLEVWEGDQKEPDVTNRYGVERNYKSKTSKNGYYPCKLIKEYRLEDIKTDKFSLREFKNLDE